MPTNLLKTVQQNLGYPVLQKMDPNLQGASADDNIPIEDRFSQSAIPAVLISLCKYTQSDSGATEILEIKKNSDWVSKIWGHNKDKAMESIANYSQLAYEFLTYELNEIANEAIKVSKQNLTSSTKVEELKTFLDNQRSDILLYLPAALNFGELLHSDTLDDSTNKMEGPISSLIQTIGSVFDNPTTKKEVEF